MYTKYLYICTNNLKNGNFLYGRKEAQEYEKVDKLADIGNDKEKHLPQRLKEKTQKQIYISEKYGSMPR